MRRKSLYFYPRPPRGGRPPLSVANPLEWYFYPRPPRGGRRVRAGEVQFLFEFLSTPSARRATPRVYLFMLAGLDFYPRPPRGGRRGGLCDLHRPIGISIHALREEGDASCQLFIVLLYLFLSTPSARRATWPRIVFAHESFISIHALREEGDRLRVMSRRGTWLFLSTPSARRATRRRCREKPEQRYFYPRPPRGGRLVVVVVGSVEMLFLSTPSARRATYPQKYQHQNNPISIHALREEGDARRRCARSGSNYFYPRPPRGGRPAPQ